MPLTALPVYRLWAGYVAVCSVVSPALARFVDVTEDSGLSYVQLADISAVLPLSNPVTHLYTGGAAAGDFDNDGWVDLYVTRMDGPDILFRNLGPDPVDGVVRFEDVSEQAGITHNFASSGAVWFDSNNNGHLDLYVSTIYETRFLFYENQGDGTFLERARSRGLALQLELRDQPGARHRGFGIGVGDYDRDGFLDLHTNEWETPFAEPDPEGLFPNTKYFSVLLRNLGDLVPGFFEIKTRAAGVALRGLVDGGPVRLQSSFGSNFIDMDDDGWPDLLVTADFETSQLFWNNGDGTFTEGTAAAGVGLETSGMGPAFGDFDRDGLTDWWITAISGNVLYRNLGDRTFEEVGRAMGLLDGGWGWGTQFFDHNNNGSLDIVMTNGMDDLSLLDQPDKEPAFRAVDQSILWVNDGAGGFIEMSDELGIVDRGPGKALVTFDYDNDGDLDIFIVNAQSTPILYRNDTENDHAWLRVDLHGIASNHRGVGARLALVPREGDNPQVHKVIGGSQYVGQSEITAHFGLGELSEKVASLEIRWPSGVVQVLRDLPLNRELTVVEPATFAEWQRRHFSLREREEDDFAGPSADPDDDGLTNFEEYAFGRNPRSPDANASRSPALACELHAVDQGWTLRLGRPAGRPDAHYRYEISSDLATWTPLESASTVAPLSDGQNEFLDFALPVSDEVLFVRLLVAPNFAR